MIQFHVLVEATGSDCRPADSSFPSGSTKRLNWVLVVGPEAWEDLVFGQAPAKIKVTVVLTWMEWLRSECFSLRRMLIVRDTTPRPVQHADKALIFFPFQFLCRLHHHYWG